MPKVTQTYTFCGQLLLREETKLAKNQFRNQTKQRPIYWLIPCCFFFYLYFNCVFFYPLRNYGQNPTQLCLYLRQMVSDRFWQEREKGMELQTLESGTVFVYKEKLKKCFHVPLQAWRATSQFCGGTLSYTCPLMYAYL